MTEGIDRQIAALTKKSRFNPISAAIVEATPSPNWRVKYVLPVTGIAAIYGASASGKSFVDLELAAAIAEGSPFFGYAAKPAAVLYVADGPAKVCAAMLESKDVAAVIFHSPGFLVGIHADTHSKLRYEAAERWAPEAYKRMTDSVALRELAPKFDKAAASVRNSFYNPTVAAKASTRVRI